MKKHLSTIILILVFFAGLSVLLYPAVSDRINRSNQSRAIADYEARAEEMDKQDYSSVFRKAEAYNDELRAAGKDAFYDPALLKGYNETLDITGTGIMGYLEIPKLDIELPVYHGTDPAVLQIAAGHLEGTSLPIGGRGSHAVISAHRGLPSAKLFSNLDRMKVGDEFSFTVLDRRLTYRAEAIEVVLPDEVDSLQIDKDKDYLSLMTCTPYGVNSHRLIIRGVRAADGPAVAADAAEHLPVRAEARRFDPLQVAPVVAVPFLLVLLIAALAGKSKKNKR